jgi:flagellar hook-associated protein FlgK
MMINLNDLIPLATILGAAAAPTIAAIWAESRRDRDAKIAAQKVSEVKEKLVETAAATGQQLGEIHALVNNQLTEAVERLNMATAEIEELKTLLKESHRREKELGGGLMDDKS